MRTKECENKCPYCDNDNIWMSPEPYKKVYKNETTELWYYGCTCLKCYNQFRIIERHIVEYVHSEYE